MCRVLVLQGGKKVEGLSNLWHSQQSIMKDFKESRDTKNESLDIWTSHGQSDKPALDTVLVSEITLKN